MGLREQTAEKRQRKGDESIWEKRREEHRIMKSGDFVLNKSVISPFKTKERMKGEENERKKQKIWKLIFKDF